MTTDTHLSTTDYARAEQMLAPYRSRRVPRVTPHWIADGRRFWYEAGRRWVLVDPAAGTRHDAFDHDRLAAELSRATGTAVVASDLPVASLEFDDDVPRFSALGGRWSFADGTLTRLDDGPTDPFELPSPDERWVAFRRDGNVWVRSAETGDETALTDDAEPGVQYGALTDAMSSRMNLRRLGLRTIFLAFWSPDSTRLLVHRLDERGVAEQVLVESSPADGGRPVEHRFRYPIPGDEAQATMSWAVIDVAEGTVVRQDEEPRPIVHPVTLTHVWWSGEKGEAVHHLRQSRDARTLELVRLDPSTGGTTTLVQETGETRVDPTPQLGEPPMVRVLDSGEILWWSQRDGWGHLYLYPGGSDEPVQLTRGSWLVRTVLWVDEDTRQVWFLATGLVADDPYARQICRVGLDGTGFTRLTDDDLDHDAESPAEGGHLLDRASTPAHAPRSRVLGGDGQVLVELEAPTTDALVELGWSPPERFRTTAADGRTPVYGLLWRPHGFDPARRYPVIDSIYPGPQIHRAGPAFDSAMPGTGEALAALGFAVVAIDGRGTAGRSKAFHDHSYRHLGDAGALDDHVAAIRELGLRYPWLDTERVGITGHSGGGFATARALVSHPEFYSVGVATSGSHDARVYVTMWAEQYHGDGDPLDLATSELAGNLRGKLLLIHGELDDNVHPYQTLRLVDSFVEADVDVDMFIVPGVDHSLVGRSHHVVRRTWDYFVRHLHGTEPPRFRLAALPAPQGLAGL
ncbi:S9 family peptidase [Actinomycetospora termitidis]|uniref:DPP IV N-terminal domain-containing protein n=1 Tax=Actinomycetospora termitidis TaxID=3053470 RepID=A0ABT7MCE7_9PSEU|nr:DPP IV N-terminal domain-containing protein [Actinomycetospora sp. Odt1-22]MDL5158345.1 DPP IV N-terminal domain-containing protein [Actinomycetospora sp. Odt1-22]